ncbi:MAG: rhodanese-like domain-containing protein [Bacteroidetes bacterium]|jgi:rhodanese-related sulfurtransferase|nr:rhodanese-like domain-containing protein [Bacteroidota bacterium]
MFTTLHPLTYLEQSASVPYFLIDLRGKRAFQTNGIAGSVHMPYHTIPDHLDKIPVNRPVLLLCDNGDMSAAARNFIMGYARRTNVMSLESGLDGFYKVSKRQKAG